MRAGRLARLSAPPSTTGPLRFVRVNSFGSEWFDDDLAFVTGLAHIDGVVLPKAESVVAVTTVAKAMGSRAVVPLLETARGILNARKLAAASAMVPAVLFGAEDLTAEIGVPRTIDGDELIFARSQVVLAAVAAGVQAIDAVFVDVASASDLRRDAERARALGFSGKMAIHPNQIAVIHDVFSPSEAEVAAAKRIVDAYEAAEAHGEGVLRLDNKMIDAPIVARARRLLARTR